MDKQIEEKISFLLEKDFGYETFLRNGQDSGWSKKLRLLNDYRLSWKNLKSEKEFCEEILNSTDFEGKEEKELLSVQEEIKKINESKLEILEKTELLLSSEENNIAKDNCIVEIRPGAGGDEAKLFTKTIFQMYLKFSEKKKWKVETINSRTDQLGGFSFISFLVKGKGSFHSLKNESGVHRVQRVPETESKGRVQTSTVTVVVLPEIDEVSVKIEEKDLKIDTYKSSGAGGQHVNTTDSAVRITHLPTGIFTTSQDGRSQIENRKYAMTTLRSIINEREKRKKLVQLGEIRSSAIGSSERSEKIRTYNFQQSRVTDHRILFHTNKLENFINGEIEELCEKLINHEKEVSNNKNLRLKKIELFTKKIENNEK